MSRRLSASPILTLALAACGAGSEDAPNDGGASTAPHADSAQELYVKRCGGCHGPVGAGGEFGPQILNPVVGYATYVVRTGRDEMGYPSGMKAFPEETVPAEDVTAILDFLREAAKPEDGQGLYLRFCGNCHGADASGGRVGEALVDETDEDEFAETVREGEGGLDYGNREEFMPAYSSTELTDEEVELIRQYVESLGPSDEDDEDDED